MNCTLTRGFAGIILLLAIFITPARAGDPPEVNLRRTVTVEVVEKTKAAVVNISAEKIITQRVQAFGGDPFWQQFDLGQVEKVPGNSLGSGFIVHRDGYVVTNNHVVDRARSISVELVDGRKLPAELISSDPEADLAILKISSDKPFPTLELGDTGDLMIGEPVIAIGNPLGYSNSVSTGVVSAIHRDLRETEESTLKDLIQTDAAINPGNSGGPLLNAYGQVIGINTAIRGDAQNIGFAIGVNRLRDLIPELMNPSQSAKVDVPLRLAERRTLTPPASVSCEIINTENKQVIKSIAGEEPKNIIDACAILLRMKAGQSFDVRYVDKPNSELVIAKATPLPDAIVQAKKRLGITVEQMTPMLSEKYQVSVEDGLFVREVDRGSIAAKAGIKAGDVLIQLGRYRVLTLDDLSVLMQHLPDSGQVRVGVMRGDEVGYGVLDF